MTNPCRLIHAHSHRRLPAGTIGTIVQAQSIAPPSMRLLRIRWLTTERAWEACYVFCMV